MKKFAQVFVVVAVLAGFTLYVTAESPHQQTTAPVSSTFELVQGTTTTAITVRLNRMTGDAWFLMDAKKGGGGTELSWVKIAPPPLGPGPLKVDVPQFQIYIAGSGFSAVYMLHSPTGRTWVLSGEAGPRVDPKLSWVEINER